jgi:hypothetical protein
LDVLNWFLCICVPAHMHTDLAAVVAEAKALPAAVTSCGGCARSYIDYIRRGGGGTPGGPAAARLIYAANRKLCSVHCHKARQLQWRRS